MQRLCFYLRRLAPLEYGSVFFSLGVRHSLKFHTWYQTPPIDFLIFFHPSPNGYLQRSIWEYDTSRNISTYSPSFEQISYRHRVCPVACDVLAGNMCFMSIDSAIVCCLASRVHPRSASLHR